MPDAVPWYELSEQRASSRNRPSILDGDGGERHRLRHAPPLTERITLTERGARKRCGEKPEERDVGSAAGKTRELHAHPRYISRWPGSQDRVSSRDQA